MAVGSVPNTAGLGLERVRRRDRRRAATSPSTGSPGRTCPGIYAAGDCTGVLLLASVAAMQGRIAMWHALGRGRAPLRLRTVSANVFTDPELATVGVSQADVDTGKVPARQVMLPLAGNARAKMAGLQDGFVKLFCRPASGEIIGGVVVAPKASELILPITMAVENHLTVNQLAHTYHDLPVAVRLDRRGGPSADAARAGVGRPTRASAQPAAPNSVAATAATANSRQADWVRAVPPMCPTSVPYEAQPSAAAVSYRMNKRYG